MLSQKKSNILSKIGLNLIMITVALFCVVPLVYIVSASFSSKAALTEYGYTLIPKEFDLSAYKFVLKSPKQILTAYGVTIFVTVFGTIVSLLCTSMLGYVMSRKDFRFHRLLSFMVLFTLLFNGGLVPTYITINNYYKLGDTIWAEILPYIIIPWHVFLMRGFFNNVPTSLIEAARMDGAGEIRTFFRIVVPISKPAFATVGLFTAFTYWNDWYLSLMYINEANLQSLQYYLYRIMNNINFMTSSMVSSQVMIDMSSIPSESARMALCVIAAGPMLLVFPFFQKYFVKGISIGAVKG